ncbi:hypothetical protein SAMN05660895_0740 [Thermoflavifilum thermophilum]|uniref:Uncharacterized protein n=1 Tax=Thermoflavifilum thermophilum TaxID=1393122 RepID=A0A1I7N6P6_9BACT|nr:hypothetical protein SAMN05660895_0740 [Thermoflavifilum thermophilum]
MPRKKQPSSAKRPVESYEHRGKERLNNPPVGLVTPETDPDATPLHPGTLSEPCALVGVC